eukprot:TRINITY_DN344_c1_g1_i10.p2 TRINITY_DN344_c1_g1~~TRINITY_DN344_c1_g1_i10.p2  ORF type:complete len:518 (-),score=46.36 TRINITY_DN344_c1_g1_i10:5418-6764(-)
MLGRTLAVGSSIVSRLATREDADKLLALMNDPENGFYGLDNARDVRERWAQFVANETFTSSLPEASPAEQSQYFEAAATPQDAEEKESIDASTMFETAPDGGLAVEDPTEPGLLAAPGSAQMEIDPDDTFADQTPDQLEDMGIQQLAGGGGAASAAAPLAAAALGMMRGGLAGLATMGNDTLPDSTIDSLAPVVAARAISAARARSVSSGSGYTTESDGPDTTGPVSPIPRVSAPRGRVSLSSSRARFVMPVSAASAAAAPPAPGIPAPVFAMPTVNQLASAIAAEMKKQQFQSGAVFVKFNNPQHTIRLPKGSSAPPGFFRVDVRTGAPSKVAERSKTYQEYETRTNRDGTTYENPTRKIVLPDSAPPPVVHGMRYVDVTSSPISAPPRENRRSWYPRPPEIVRRPTVFPPARSLVEPPQRLIPVSGQRRRQLGEATATRTVRTFAV